MMTRRSGFRFDEPTEELYYIRNRIRSCMLHPRDVDLVQHVYHEVLEFMHMGHYFEPRDEMRGYLHTLGSILANCIVSPCISRFLRDQTGVITGIWEEDASKRLEMKGSQLACLQMQGVSDNCYLKGRYASVTSASDLQGFLSSMDKGEPCVVRNGCGFWKSCTTWSKVEFWSRFRGRFVPVELGTYLSDNFQQKLVDFADFMEYVSNLEEYQELPDKLYLAQYDLFSRFPTLDEYVQPLPDFAHLMGSPVSRSVFIGPKGTVSPLHTDPYDNLLCQIVGTKYVVLFAPSESTYIYGTAEHASSITTKLPNDLTLMDQSMLDERFPMFRRSSGFELHIFPGDCLYIPRGWFHFVKSNSPAISLAHFKD